jgi:hypothetical protein
MADAGIEHGDDEDAYGEERAEFGGHGLGEVAAALLVFETAAAGAGCVTTRHGNLSPFLHKGNQAQPEGFFLKLQFLFQTDCQHKHLLVDGDLSPIC